MAFPIAIDRRRARAEGRMKQAWRRDSRALCAIASDSIAATATILAAAIQTDTT